MKTNPMRAGLERGEPQIGTWLTMVRNPAILSLMQAAGLDFARVDMEHTATTIEQVADLAVLSRALDFPIAVRPPKANREWITRLLDVGVMNLHCPQVENAAHAREIVAASRYAPMGLRGNGGLSASTDFDGTLSATAKRAHANREVFITVMFETAKAFDDLEEIAAMPGIDALTVGPADLAQDLGVFGTPDQVAAQIRRLYEKVGGFDHLLMMMQAGFLDHKRTVSNIRLLAKEVYPQIKDLPGLKATLPRLRSQLTKMSPSLRTHSGTWEVTEVLSALLGRGWGVTTFSVQAPLCTILPSIRVQPLP